MNFRFQTLLVIAWANFLPAALADAPQGFGLSEKQQSRNDKQLLEILAAFEPIVGPAGESTVAITDGERLLALGTIVDANGGIVTKASELGSARLQCVFQDGTAMRAEVEKTLSKYDLAFLRVRRENLKVAPFARSMPVVGSLVATPSSRGQVSGVGVVSVGPRDLSEQGKGYLGVGIFKRDEKLVLRNIGQGTAAEKAGLKAGDVLLHLEGKRYASVETFAEEISNKAPNTVIAIGYERNGKAAKAKVTLGDREDASDLFNPLNPMDRTMGGPTSKNRTGYPQAWQHDIALRPQEMGGPIVDLDGRVLGINISRAGRVKTYAIPSSVILDWLGEESVVAPQNEPDDDELDELFRQLKEAERSLQEAREKLDKAKSP